MIVEFKEFPKIARLSREVIVTEKIDGTSGTIYIGDDGDMYVGSRNRWITPDDDNYGFARWAFDHALELHEGLGPGWHRGEWWGSGIQRGYGLQKGEKRFSLFNTVRWCLYGTEPQTIPTGGPRQVKMQDVLPVCCSLVPVLWRGIFSTEEIEASLICLAVAGSQASPGFMKPEGIVVYHVAGNIAFKKTIKT
jgi:hypothetical protein